MATVATRIRDAAAAAGARLARLSLGPVPAPYRAWVIVCWLVAVLLAGAILVPLLTAGIQAEQVGTTGPVGRFRAPLGIRLLLTAAGAVLAGGLVVVLLVRERTGAGRRGARELAMVAVAAFPVLALAADREWVAAVAAAVLLGFAELVAHRQVAAHRGGIALVGVLAGSPWLVLLVAQAGAPQDGAGSWAFIALFGFAAAFAAFGTYYGVAQAASSRSRLLSPLFRDDASAPVVLGIVLLALAVAVLRLTVARDLFADPDPALWSPLGRPPASWLHASLVAGLVVVVAARSVRRPLRRAREGAVVAGLAVTGNADLVLAVGIIVVGMFAAAAGAGTVLPDPGAVAIAVLKLAGVVAVVVAVLLPVFRGTAARALGLITGAYLLPLTVEGLLRVLGVRLPEGLAGFPASPVQVALLLVGVAVVAAIAGLAGPAARPFGSSLVIRLAVVPVVAVHAGLLLPAAWSGLGRFVVVAGVLGALLFLLPRPSASPDARAAELLGASALAVLALAVYLLALPSFVDDPAIIVLGLFWLAVAVIAAGVIRTVDDAADPPPQA